MVLCVNGKFIFNCFHFVSSNLFKETINFTYIGYLNILVQAAHDLFDIPCHCNLSLLVLLFAIMGKSPNVKFLSTKNELHERRLLDLDYLALSEHPIYNPIYIHNEWCGCLVFISFAMSLSSFQSCSRSIRGITGSPCVIFVVFTIGNIREYKMTPWILQDRSY